ncbi:DUF6126 family protein [Streptomyces sp. NPDC059506]|nr:MULTISPECIES: DUF6126 family protein [unclassified Streptomyces]MCZ2524745.1 DUF6126 family protein [Streptomyces sp. HB2AG]
MDSSDEKNMSRHLWIRVAYFFFVIHALAFFVIWVVSRT